MLPCVHFSLPSPSPSPQRRLLTLYCMMSLLDDLVASSVKQEICLRRPRQGLESWLSRRACLCSCRGPVSGPSTHIVVHTGLNFCYRGLHVLFGTLQAQGTYIVHRETCIQNAIAMIIIINK